MSFEGSLMMFLSSACLYSLLLSMFSSSKTSAFSAHLLDERCDVGDKPSSLGEYGVRELHEHHYRQIVVDARANINVKLLIDGDSERLENRSCHLSSRWKDLLDELLGLVCTGFAVVTFSKMERERQKLSRQWMCFFQWSRRQERRRRGKNGEGEREKPQQRRRRERERRSMHDIPLQVNLDVICHCTKHTGNSSTLRSPRQSLHV